MIEKVIQEKVVYMENTSLRLYDNRELDDYPSHWHTPAEIICSVEGEYTVVCKNHKYRLVEGDTLIICPGTIHSLHAPPSGNRIIFQANCNVLYSIKQIETLLSLVGPALHITPTHFPNKSAQVYQLVLEIRDQYFADTPWSEALIYSKLIEMMVLVGEGYTENKNLYDATPRKSQEYNAKLLAVCTYIQKHCTEALTLDEVADQVGFSKFHFERLFKQFTGVPFYRYLNLQRIALAEEMLIDPAISVTDVAMRCGFSSATSFTRMFKNIKLCPPTEFRRMYNTN